MSAERPWNRPRKEVAGTLATMAVKEEVCMRALPEQHAKLCGALTWGSIHLESQRCVIFGATGETLACLEWFCVGTALEAPGGRKKHGGRFAFMCPEEVVLTPEELLFLLAEAIPRGLMPPLGMDTPRVPTEQLLRFFTWEEPRFLARYSCYRHFRLRLGYVIRAGTGFGVDFMLYKGSPNEVHASYGLWVIHSPPFAPESKPSPRREKAPWLLPDPLMDTWNDSVLEAQALQKRKRCMSTDDHRKGRLRRKRSRSGKEASHSTDQETQTYGEGDAGAVSWSELQQVCRVMRSVKKNLIVAWSATTLSAPGARADVRPTVDSWTAKESAPMVDKAWQDTLGECAAMTIECVRFLGVSVTGKHGEEEEDTEAAEGNGASQTIGSLLGEENAPAMAFQDDEDML